MSLGAKVVLSFGERRPMSWQYIAGFFDGEGDLGYNENRFRFRIWQSGKEGHEILLRIRSFLLEHGINSSVAGGVSCRKGSFSKKPVYYLTVLNRESVIVATLKNVYPFLHIKESKALDMIRIDKLFPNFCANERSWLRRERLFTGRKNELQRLRRLGRGRAKRGEPIWVSDQI